jgi:hypothetical protein
MRARVYTSTTGFLKVEFTSDPAAYYPGFEAKWIAVADPACIKCEEGKYSTPTEPTLYNALNYDQPGPEVCIDCDPNTYSQAGASFCLMCSRS